MTLLDEKERSINVQAIVEHICVLVESDCPPAVATATSRSIFERCQVAAIKQKTMEGAAVPQRHQPPISFVLGNDCKVRFVMLSSIVSHPGKGAFGKGVYKTRAFPNRAGTKEKSDLLRINTSLSIMLCQTSFKFPSRFRV